MAKASKKVRKLSVPAPAADPSPIRLREITFKLAALVEAAQHFQERASFVPACGGYLISVLDLIEDQVAELRELAGD